MSETARLLVVDDETNIRLTLSRALETVGFPVDTAENAEEALSLLAAGDYTLILLDLRMPGMDGMDMLAEVRRVRPDIGVIIITAHGTIDVAVEAMKLGAVDFIQKPFSPDEIRELVMRVIDREGIAKQRAQDYTSQIELAKLSIAKRQFGAALEHVRRAIALDANSAQAFYLMGTLQDVQGQPMEAQNSYRAALGLDPTHEAARHALEAAARRPLRRATLGRRGDGRTG